jgi:type II restriction/modification system DNA methylase subunit YeeA
MAINTSILKSYAPQARRDFIAAVKTRAARFGIVDGGSATIQEQGEVAIINGQAYPRTVARQCRDLQGKIRLRGFDAVMEEVAYTWFNRFAAIRYMELHGYLDHGFRVLSHPAGETTPEIVQHAEKVDLPGLKADRVVELKLDGRKDEELFRILLVAQCNALHAAMPFLFERIDDETELLLPDNLLHSESVIRQMVAGIPEGDWQAIEIIGWLYQFYISEKKDQVIGTVVKSEDIPAATQLFTPNWIVKYMVQNSLGAMWLATYPDSPIRAKMAYYIEPVDQSEEVQRQIEAETPKSLDPEKVTFLDPASGSGHILVEAYDLFKEIYLERGYRLRDIPRLILEKNLYGLDIDDRAAQLSGFALMMRARADDRLLLTYDESILLNVSSIQESAGVTSDDVAKALRLGTQSMPAPIEGGSTEGVSALATATPEVRAIESMLVLFSDAKTLGSLAVPPPIRSQSTSEDRRASGDIDLVDAADALNLIHARKLLRQADLLSRQYDIVVANPPYMGSKGMNQQLRAHVQRHFPAAKADLMTCFMERAVQLTRPGGYWAMINLPSWMFLGSFTRMRETLLQSQTFLSLLQLGRGVFGSDFGSVAFAVRNVRPNAAHVGTYRRLFEKHVQVRNVEVIRQLFLSPRYGLHTFAQGSFQLIAGSPIAYWVSAATLSAFQTLPPLNTVASPRQGMATTNNDRFLRYWFEVSKERTGFNLSAEEGSSSEKKWFPINKGGEFRRWYGNNMFVVNFEHGGREMCEYIDNTPNVSVKSNGRVINREYYFREGLTWSTVSSGQFSLRFSPKGSLFETKGAMIFFDNVEDSKSILALLNTKLTGHFLAATSPTLDYHEGPVGRLPLKFDESTVNAQTRQAAERAVQLAKDDWDSFEISWDFDASPILASKAKGAKVADACQVVRQRWRNATDELRLIETANNTHFARAYGLGDEIDPDVPVEEISLNGNPHYRYGNDGELEDNLEADTIREFVSYSVGCIVGRYSPDQAGLILANQGDALSDYLAKVPNPSFVADADNIIPMLDDNWFEDDVTDRFLEFLKVTFGTEHFDENLAFVEKALGKDIRKFFKRDFFSDHLKRYKRRPIYWVFSSGKEKAFEAIVYMHRYNETTLARMRMNYVVPLQSQMANRIERLGTELTGANLSSADRKRKDTQRAKLIKQLEELGRFEEELRHLADQRTRIDLDDGVKVNYGKFGSLLAEVKAVTGGTDD